MFTAEEKKRSKINLEEKRKMVHKYDWYIDQSIIVIFNSMYLNTYKLYFGGNNLQLVCSKIFHLY